MFNSGFVAHLFSLVLCFIVLALFVIVLYLMSNVDDVSGLSIQFSLRFYFFVFVFIPCVPTI